MYCIQENICAGFVSPLLPQLLVDEFYTGKYFLKMCLNINTTICFWKSYMYVQKYTFVVFLEINNFQNGKFTEMPFYHFLN